MASLFQNAADIRNVMKSMNASAEDMISYVEEGEDLYMEEFLTAAFLTELRDALATANYVIGNLTTEQQAIIAHLRKASAYYGKYRALPHLNMNITNIGTFDHQGEGSQRLAQWQYNKGAKSSISTADRYMYKAL